MSKFEHLTADTGTSHWKMFYRNRSLILPALVSSGPLREQANGVFEPSYSTASADNISLITPFGQRFVGNLAKQSTTLPWAAFDRAKYARAEFLLPMLLGGMSELRVTGETIVLVTAVPGEWAKDKALKAQLETHFLTEHVINREGKRGEQIVNICRVEVLSETGGLFYSYLLDADGEVAIEDYQNQRVAVIDIGEHTTCVDVFIGPNREGRVRSYTDLSMGEIHETVARRITEETGRHLEPWEVRDVVMGAGHIPYSAKGKVKQFDIMPLYHSEVGKAKDRLYSIASQTIKNAHDFAAILIGGGGSTVLGETLQEVYPQARICGQLATGQGLHNYGARLCRNHLNR